jgi:hypothetical protein
MWIRRCNGLFGKKSPKTHGLFGMAFLGKRPQKPKSDRRFYKKVLSAFIAPE